MRDPTRFCLAIIAVVVLVGVFGDHSKRPENLAEKAAAHKRAAQADLVLKGLAEWRLDPLTGEVRLVRLTKERAK